VHQYLQAKVHQRLYQLAKVHQQVPANQHQTQQMLAKALQRLYQQANQ